MYVFRLICRVAYLDGLHPGVRHDLFSRPAKLWIRLQHLTDQWTAGAGGQVGYRWGVGGLSRVSGSTCSLVGNEKVIASLGGSPRHLLEVKAVVDDTACPYVNKACVVWFTEELFRSYVGFTTAQSRGHVNG